MSALGMAMFLLTIPKISVIFLLGLSCCTIREGVGEVKIFSNFSFVLLLWFFLTEILIFILGYFFKKYQNRRGILFYRILLVAAAAAYYLALFLHYGFDFWK